MSHSCRAQERLEGAGAGSRIRVPILAWQALAAVPPDDFEEKRPPARQSQRSESGILSCSMLDGLSAAQPFRGNSPADIREASLGRSSQPFSHSGREEFEELRFSSTTPCSVWATKALIPGTLAISPHRSDVDVDVEAQLTGGSRRQRAQTPQTLRPSPASLPSLQRWDRKGLDLRSTDRQRPPSSQAVRKLTEESPPTLIRALVSDFGLGLALEPNSFLDCRERLLPTRRCAKGAKARPESLGRLHARKGPGCLADHGRHLFFH